MLQLSAAFADQLIDCRHFVIKRTFPACPDVDKRRVEYNKGISACNNYFAPPVLYRSGAIMFNAERAAFRTSSSMSLPAVSARAGTTASFSRPSYGTRPSERHATCRKTEFSLCKTWTRIGTACLSYCWQLIRASAA